MTQVVVTCLRRGVSVRSFATGTILLLNLLVTSVALLFTARTSDIGDRLRGSWTAVRRATGSAGNACVMLGVDPRRVRRARGRLPHTLLLRAPGRRPGTRAYHLVPAAAWIRADRIVVSPLAVLANSSPLNGDMTFVWVGALTRSDLLVDLPQVGFAALGAIAVAAIARTIGVSKIGSLAAACLYFLTPVVLLQASTAYVDLVLPGLFLAGYACCCASSSPTTRATADQPPRWSSPGSRAASPRARSRSG